MNSPDVLRKQWEIPMDDDKQTLRNAIDAASQELFSKLMGMGEKKGEGWNDQLWLDPDWHSKLKADILEHLFKGDPLDVMAYCVFAHYHGWDVKPETFFSEGDTTKKVNFYYNVQAVITKARRSTREYKLPIACEELIMDLADMLTITNTELLIRERQKSIVEKLINELETELEMKKAKED